MVHCLRFADAGGPEFTALMPGSPIGVPNGWWGYNSIKSDPSKYQHRETALERRVLATIEWVVQKCHIDRNRIYLCGISMGGSGTLGIGLCHGDIFAALLAGVPAGAGHASYRMHFPPPPAASASPAEREKYLAAVSGAGLPDAPPLLDFSSQQDVWSKDQPQLLQAIHDGRHAVVFAWGPWGHVNHYEMTDRAAYEFPWLRIRKDEAYPVFTDASTDRHYPGCNPPHPDADGQINAYFRWKAVEDAAGRFAIELRLVRQGRSDRAQSHPGRVGRRRHVAAAAKLQGRAAAALLVDFRRRPAGPVRRRRGGRRRAVGVQAVGDPRRAGPVERAAVTVAGETGERIEILNDFGDHAEGRRRARPDAQSPILPSSCP